MVPFLLGTKRTPNAPLSPSVYEAQYLWLGFLGGAESPPSSGCVSMDGMENGSLRVELS